MYKETKASGKLDISLPQVNSMNLKTVWVIGIGNKARERKYNHRIIDLEGETRTSGKLGYSSLRKVGKVPQNLLG